jgi:hypothetical protein
MLHRLPFVAIALALLLVGAVGCGTCGPSARAPSDGSQDRNSSTASTAVAVEGQDSPGLKELDDAQRPYLLPLLSRLRRRYQEGAREVSQEAR